MDTLTTYTLAITGAIVLGAIAVYVAYFLHERKVKKGLNEYLENKGKKEVKNNEFEKDTDNDSRGAEKLASEPAIEPGSHPEADQGQSDIAAEPCNTAADAGTGEQRGPVETAATDSDKRTKRHNIFGNRK